MNLKKLGKYTLLEQIAVGGMAEIHLAYEIDAEGSFKFYAIKKILNAYSEVDEFVSLFKDEARIASQLNHFNIVNIYDFGADQSNQVYIAMEFVHGRNLKQIVQALSSENRKLPIEFIAYIIKEVANGLDYANSAIDTLTGHPLNIIHRDVSPQNIMISYSGEIKIIDFGIAKAATNTEMPAPEAIKGKFGYLSPEQVRGEELDHRTDLFSLGIVMWELIANRRLFASETEKDTLKKIVKGEIPNISSFLDMKYFELAEIVQRSLAYDKNERYQSGAELANALALFLTKYFPEFNKHVFSDYLKNTFYHFYEKSQEKFEKYKSLHQVSTPDKSAVSIACPIPVVEAEAPKEWEERRSLNWIYGSAVTLAIFIFYVMSFVFTYKNKLNYKPFIGNPELISTKPTKNFEIPFEGIIALSGFGSQACVHLQNGKTYCWGDNRFHQLGPVKDPELTSPTEIKNVPIWTKLQLGEFHSCGIAKQNNKDGIERNELYCWGDNSQGQIGIPSKPNVSAPLLVDQNTEYVSISIGLYHTCGLTREGTAKCWGLGDSNQLGMEKIKSSKVPLTVDSKAKFKSISSGANHTCGILTDGSIRCWGRNDFGQIGNGQMFNAGAIENIDKQTQYESIAVGENHNCAITTSSRIKCWGKNSDGQLGVGHSDRVTKPTQIATDLKFTSVKAGRNHTCAKTEDDELYCWGLNNFSQISVMNKERIKTPEFITRLTSQGDFLISDLSTCYIVPGKLNCRGYQWIQKSRFPAEAK